MHTVPHIQLPGSKSIAARALVLNFIHGNHTQLHNLPRCNDTAEIMVALMMLKQLLDGKPTSIFSTDEFYLGPGGTSIRFFTALVASIEGFKGTLLCDPQMEKRPFAPLVDALRKAGAKIACLKKEGHAPFYIEGQKLDGTGVNIDTSISSQFASAVMMASELWSTPPTIDAEKGVSRPYLKMTEVLVKKFREEPDDFEIEADWSSAAFFYVWAMLHPGHNIFLEGLRRPEESLQGDSATAEIFSRLGVTSRFCDSPRGVTICGTTHPDYIELDLTDTPDLMPALTMALCRADIRFRITGISHLKYKESDRIAAVCQELSKAGYLLTRGDDFVAGQGDSSLYTGLPLFHDYESHGDHRIAMALIASGIASEDEIDDPYVVAKSFSDFSEEFQKLPKVHTDQ